MFFNNEWSMLMMLFPWKKLPMVKARKGESLWGQNGEHFQVAMVNGWHKLIFKAAERALPHVKV